MTIQAKKKLESYFLIITKKLASKHLRVFFAINKSAYFGWLHKERLLAKLGVKVNEALVFVSSYNLFFPVYV